MHALSIHEQFADDLAEIGWPVIRLALSPTFTEYDFDLVRLVMVTRHPSVRVLPPAIAPLSPIARQPAPPSECA